MNEDNIKVVTEFPCLLGHPVSLSVQKQTVRRMTQLHWEVRPEISHEEVKLLLK